jgi:hypothetical protein
LNQSFRLSKLSIRHISEQTDYATGETLIESLLTLRVKHNVPVDRYIEDLIERKVDSISITKDSPYYYFFARRLEGAIAVTYKEAGRVIEFSLPMQEAQKMLAK